MKHERGRAPPAGSDERKLSETTASAATTRRGYSSVELSDVEHRALVRLTDIAEVASPRRRTGGLRRAPVRMHKKRDHIHLLVEADNKRALSNGMQGFQISAAKHINATMSVRRMERRRGTGFPDRFHQEIIETPRHARHALSYVLNNWRKHREDRVEHARTWNVDPFSTGSPCDCSWSDLPP